MTTRNLCVRSLRKSFGANQVLRGVDLTCAPGEITAIVGRNGSGKSTLLNCLSGRLRGDSGEIELAGVALQEEPAWKRARRGFAWTSQDVSAPLTLSIEALIDLARASVGSGDGGSVKLIPRVLVEATRPFAGQAWNRLSFGQRKLGALAIATARSPQILLLDEPVAGLSAGFTDVASEAVAELAARGIIVLVVEHNRPFLERTASRVAVLSAGEIVVSGSPADVFADARTLEALV